MSAPEAIADYACICGEGPMWHAGERRLYWVDIPRGRLFRYDPTSGRHEICRQGSVLGGFTIQADGSLLLFLEGCAIEAWTAAGTRAVLAEVPDERQSRWNDVIADPAGRVFCGSMPSPGGRLGSLYRLETDGRLTHLLGGIGCSNGMGFAPDRRRMYYTDSVKREVYLFDYDEATGELANQRLFLRFPEGETPDGMTVDADGFPWVAIWGGSRVARYSPEGREVGRVELPAKLCSSVAFGGDRLDELYVTTAGGDDRAANGPGAGVLFRLKGAGRGVEEFRSRVGLDSRPT